MSIKHIVIYGSMVAIWAFHGGCDKPGTTHATPGASPSQPAQSAPAKAIATADSRTPKVEPVAEVAGKGATVPSTQAVSPDLAAARRAWRFLTHQWKPAVEAGDATAYAALLSPGFRASFMHQGREVMEDRAGWITRMASELKANTTIDFGPPETHVVRGPATRVTLRLPERSITQGACVTRSREFTVLLWDDKAPLLANELTQNVAPCPTTDQVALANAHGALQGAIKGLEPLDPWVGAEGFTVSEAGIVTERHAAGDLQDPRFKGLQRLFSQTEADFDTTRYYGKVGRILGAQGVGLTYRHEGGAWRFSGITRPRP